MDISLELHNAVAAVCPIDGVSVGSWDDRSTWRIDFRTEATDEQRADATAVVQSFDPSSIRDPIVVNGLAFLMRLLPTEYGAIISAAASDVRLAIWIDMLRVEGQIDVGGATAKQAKAFLVGAKLLTSDRAEAVFAPP